MFDSTLFTCCNVPFFVGEIPGRGLRGLGCCCGAQAQTAEGIKIPDRVPTQGGYSIVLSLGEKNSLIGFPQLSSRQKHADDDDDDGTGFLRATRENQREKLERLRNSEAEA